MLSNGGQQKPFVDIGGFRLISPQKENGSYQIQALSGISGEGDGEGEGEKDMEGDTEAVPTSDAVIFTYLDVMSRVRLGLTDGS